MVLAIMSKLPRRLLVLPVFLLLWSPIGIVAQPTDPDSNATTTSFATTPFGTSPTDNTTDSTTEFTTSFATTGATITPCVLEANSTCFGEEVCVDQAYAEQCATLLEAQIGRFYFCFDTATSLENLEAFQILFTEYFNDCFVKDENRSNVIIDTRTCEMEVTIPGYENCYQIDIIFQVACVSDSQYGFRLNPYEDLLCKNFNCGRRRNLVSLTSMASERRLQVLNCEESFLPNLNVRLSTVSLGQLVQVCDDMACNVTVFDAPVPPTSPPSPSPTTDPTGFSTPTATAGPTSAAASATFYSYYIHWLMCYVVFICNAGGFTSPTLRLLW